MTQGSDVYSFAYLGSGDRIGQTVNGVTTTYALDLNARLTQVLSDGTNTYLYGNGRIAQMNGVDFTYFLGDALGSVRQLTDANGAVTLNKGYEPYGEVLYSQGSGASSYGYTGEWLDETGFLNLRARYYISQLGRFNTKDVWRGDYNQPLSYNAWLYTYDDPINLTDPSGRMPCEDSMEWCNGAVRILKQRITSSFGLVFSSTNDGISSSFDVENWDEQALLLIEEVSNLIAYRFHDSVDWRQVVLRSLSPRHINGVELFKQIFRGLEIRRGPKNDVYIPGTSLYGRVYNSGIYIAYGPEENWKPESRRGRNIILHELGHVMDKRAFDRFDSNGNRINNHYSSELAECNDLSPLIKRIFDYEAINGYADSGLGRNSGLGVNFRSEGNYAEIWADFFASWVINDFPSIPGQNDGTVFKNYMVSYMQLGITDLAIQMSGGEKP